MAGDRLRQQMNRNCYRYSCLMRISSNYFLVHVLCSLNEERDQLICDIHAAVNAKIMQ